ncbi:hypothetical protein SNN83_002706 [Cronobacter malonaticus]|nr:hypothetical protein [Cronobacter malonaticus]
MEKLLVKGFVESENDFSQCSAAKLMRHFHQYGFKDAEGRDLVTCKDFAALINQFCSAERKAPVSAAEHVLYSYDSQEAMNIVVGNMKEGS